MIAEASTVWWVIDWLRALGLVLVLVTVYREKRTRDTGATADIRSWTGANVTFYSAVPITLAFVPNWFGAVRGQYPDKIVGWTSGMSSTRDCPSYSPCRAARLWREAST